MAKRRRIQLIEIEKVDIGPLGAPVDAVIKLQLGGARRGYVFTLKRSAREQLTDEKYMQACQHLGDLVHPHQAVMIVMPDEAPDLKVYEVRAK